MINSGFPVTPETHSAILSVYHKTMGPDGAVEAAAFEAMQGLDGGLDTAILNNLVQSRIVARDPIGAFKYLQMFDFPRTPRSSFDSGGCFSACLSQLRHRLSEALQIERRFVSLSGSCRTKRL